MYNQTVAKICAFGVFLGLMEHFFLNFLLGLEECLEDMLLIQKNL
jgi:hypothetical protein